MHTYTNKNTCLNTCVRACVRAQRRTHPSTFTHIHTLTYLHASSSIHLSPETHTQNIQGSFQRISDPVKTSVNFPESDQWSRQKKKNPDSGNIWENRSVREVSGVKFIGNELQGLGNVSTEDHKGNNWRRDQNIYTHACTHTHIN